MWEQKDTVRGSPPRTHRLHQKARLGAGANTAAQPRSLQPSHCWARAQPGPRASLGLGLAAVITISWP